jgi:hypothetical protein
MGQISRETGQPGQVSLLGKPGQVSLNGTVLKSQQGQISLNRTVRTVQPGHRTLILDISARTGQPKKVSQDRSAETCQLGDVSPTGQPGH